MEFNDEVQNRVNNIMTLQKDMEKVFGEDVTDLVHEVYTSCYDDALKTLLHLAKIGYKDNENGTQQEWLEANDVRISKVFGAKGEDICGMLEELNGGHYEGAREFINYIEQTGSLDLLPKGITDYFVILDYVHRITAKGKNMHCWILEKYVETLPNFILNDYLEWLRADDDSQPHGYAEYDPIDGTLYVCRPYSE